MSKVVVVVALDDMLRGDEVARLRAQAAAEATDFDVDEVEASEEGLARALTAAATLPVLAPRRWVHLAEVQRLAGGQQAPLVAYLRAPSPTTVLCLSASKLDMRTSLGQALSAQGTVHEIATPRAYELPGWIADRARRQGTALAPAAAQALVEAAGDELGALCQALVTAQLYAHPTVPITAQHVEEALGSRAPARVFALVEALGGTGGWGATTVVLRRLLADGQSPAGLLAMILRQLHLLVAVHAQPPSERAAAVLAAALGVPPFAADRLAKQARALKPARAAHALKLALAADADLKRGTSPPATCLERLLYDIACAGEPAAAARP